MHVCFAFYSNAVTPLFLVKQDSADGSLETMGTVIHFLIFSSNNLPMLSKLARPTPAARAYVRMMSGKE